MTKEHKPEYLPDAICPYCGEKYEEVWVWDLEDGECTHNVCENCAKRYKITCDHIITYLTEKV